VFVTFEGIDGSGKTTLASELARVLGERGGLVDHVVKKASFGDAFVEGHTAKLRSLLWDFGPDDPMQLLGDRHWMLLQASWFAVVEERRVRPALARGATVVVDNWFFKLMARFGLKSAATRVEVEACFAHFRQPDVVFHLDVPPEVAVDRKKRFSPAECGMFDGEPTLGPESFLRYQGRVAVEMRRMAAARGWHTLRPGDATPTEIALECARVLTGLRATA
jgi:thymidylate kinase